MAAAGIGMSVPGASSLMPTTSVADQVAGETEEQRKKRLQAMQASKMLPGNPQSLAPGYSQAFGG